MTEVFIAYSNSDQAIFRAARGQFDALVIPGTVATYFREATGGFVLSLDRPYLIDPRTPVLQFRIPFKEVRSSHRTLATEYGPAFLARLENQDEGTPTSKEWVEASGAFARFQHDYASTTATKVAKYAALLGEEGPAALATPRLILPVYLMVDAPKLTEWDLVLRMLRSAVQAVPDRRVAAIAAMKSNDPVHPDLASLERMLTDLEEESVEDVFLWFNDLSERQLDAATIAAVAARLQTHPDLNLFNLYGGFLSMCLRAFTGVTSGLGYSESRDATSLYATGAAPARYYHPRLHAFLNPDTAALFVERAGDQFRCPCDVCAAAVGPGKSVRRLTHRELLLHFIHVRQREKNQTDDVRAVIKDLRETSILVAGIRPRLPSRIFDQIPVNHLNRWAEGLERSL